jgi:hypothetical protein
MPTNGSEALPDAENGNLLVTEDGSLTTAIE